MYVQIRSILISGRQVHFRRQKYAILMKCSCEAIWGHVWKASRHSALFQSIIQSTVRPDSCRPWHGIEDLLYPSKYRAREHGTPVSFAIAEGWRSTGWCLNISGTPNAYLFSVWRHFRKRKESVPYRNTCTRVEAEPIVVFCTSTRDRTLYTRNWHSSVPQIGIISGNSAQHIILGNVVGGPL